jgi:hypothetical protein
MCVRETTGPAQQVLKSTNHTSPLDLSIHRPVPVDNADNGADTRADTGDDDVAETATEPHVEGEVDVNLEEIDDGSDDQE